MDELKDKIKNALDESKTYGDFIAKLYEIPEFIDEIKGIDCLMCFLEKIRNENGNQKIAKSEKEDKGIGE